MPARPALADGTAFLEDRIEKDEAEDAVEIKKNKKHDDRQHDDGGNQSGHFSEARGIEMRKGSGYEFLFATLVRDGKVEAVEVATAGVKLRRQKSHQRQSRPLSEAKWAEELVSCVLQGGLDAVDGGDGHGFSSG